MMMSAGGLQHGVAQEAEGGQVLVAQLHDLVLVGGVALQPGNRRDHGQDQEQFGVLGYPGLHEEGAFFG